MDTMASDGKTISVVELQLTTIKRKLQQTKRIPGI